jgi:hypothetical protein
MIGEEKQLINNNIKLKMDIKTFKINETPSIITKKIDHIKAKIE